MRKVVIITGASRGIGRQCDIDLSYDYDVVINYNKSENEAKELLDKIEKLLLNEKANVEATIPLVQFDSRLGWEPSMEYIADPEHLRWKIAQVKYACETELGEYLTVAKEEA